MCHCIASNFTSSISGTSWARTRALSCFPRTSPLTTNSALSPPNQCHLQTATAGPADTHHQGHCYGLSPVEASCSPSASPSGRRDHHVCHLSPEGENPAGSYYPPRSSSLEDLLPTSLHSRVPVVLQMPQL